ncbi:MAG: hypothetical protein DWQ01_01205 [Planctomycetota bacterium]|nr:MAG: hypothetical protein DWQ01_01205 [Planctomycetota bacterium]
MNHLNRRHFLTSSLALGAAGTLGALPQNRQEPEADLPGRTPHTQFAINLEMWFRKLPFVDRIQAAADLGFSWVEFWPWRGKKLDQITQAAEKAGVKIAQFTGWGFVPGLNHPKNHAAFVKELEASCQAAKQLKCSMMTIVGGNDQPGMSQAEMHQNIIDGLKLGAPIAEQHDVMMILEPMNIRVDHKGHCLYGSPDAVRICREVNSTHVKINWDLYHMQISEGDLCGRLRDGFDQVGYIQLADHPGRREPGTGEIHYNRVLKELWDLGYRKPVGVECWPSEDEAAAARRLALADRW